MSARNFTSVSVDPDAVAEFNRELQDRMGRTVWNTGCRSWYLDASGRNTTLWPDFTWRFRQRTRRFDADRYLVTRASGRSIPTH